MTAHTAQELHSDLMHNNAFAWKSYTVLAHHLPFAQTHPPVLTQENKKKFLNALIDIRVGPSHGHRRLPPPFFGSVQ